VPTSYPRYISVSFDPFELQDTILGDVRDPYAVLVEARRRHGPVQPGVPMLTTEMAGNPVNPGAPMFSIYGHDAVAIVLRDGATFSSTAYEDVVGMVMGHSILEMDEPEHRLHRALLSPAFRTKALARWEQDLVHLVVDELIDAFVDTGQAELVRQFTFAFPVQVIARILGLPRSEYPAFQRWSIELLSVFTNWDRGMAASAALRDYFGGVLADRRVNPQDDLISDLSVAEVDGRRLSDEEIFAFLRLLLPAGVETTYRSSGNLLYGLLTHPDQLEALVADRALLPQAIEEGLRWEPPIIAIVRRTTCDTTLEGVPIPAGAIINVCVGAANRDDKQYPEPDRFDIFRNPKQHMTFGFGPHMCIGMHLARMETRVAVNALLDRLPDLRLDPAREPPYLQGAALRSPPALHVLFG
jgi:cytochrome P450